MPEKILFRITVLLSTTILLSSCQLGYITQSAYYQADLMRKRVPLNYALTHYDLTDKERAKIELTIKVRQFMANELSLKTDNNFSRYVHLDRPYVTYAVNASPKDKLETYSWKFPIIGKVPYKGFFKEEFAKKEAKKLQKQGLDTYVRGVSAYSTLGWFEDPLLSSMLRMREHHFINTLIHETIHANLYIKGHSKFNERIATYLGQLGTEDYYQKQNRLKELKGIVKKETHDELLFSEFISREIKSLKSWYKNYQGHQLDIERQQKFKEMKQNFQSKILPKMKTKNYQWFAKKQLNNAFLLLLGLYNSDFSTLEKIANHHQRDFQAVFKVLKSLEDSQNPEADLKKIADSY